MDLVSWALNAVDRIFSTRTPNPQELPCPQGTEPFGYTVDSKENWRVVCFGNLEIEDVEDLYLCVFLLTGLLALGAGLMLIWKNTAKMRKDLAELKRMLAARRERAHDEEALGAPEVPP